MSIIYKGRVYDSVKDAANITGDWYPTIWRIVHLKAPLPTVSVPIHRRPATKPLKPATRDNSLVSRRHPLPKFRYPVGHAYNAIFKDGTDEIWHLCNEHYQALLDDAECLNIQQVLGQAKPCDWCQVSE